jgi:heptose I phosphotransferase
VTDLSAGNHFFISPGYQPLMRVVGLDAEAVFNHPQIVAWRKLADRENCTLDAEFEGRAVRLHIKRYAASRTAGPTPAEAEVASHRLLLDANVATLDVVGWGKLADGRSFFVTADLTGYRAADKLIDAGTPFEKLLAPTADMAGKLHRAGLHHRDLYLCHFFAKVEGDVVDVRLIDVARVSRFGRLLRRRWIVKDLAQFWYSTLAHGAAISDEQRRRWLSTYAGHEPSPRFVRAIERKVRAIGRHDAKLRKAQPTRNISIPTTP